MMAMTTHTKWALTHSSILSILVHLLSVESPRF